MTKDEEQKAIIDAYFKALADAKILSRTEEDRKKDSDKFRKVWKSEFGV